MDALVHERSAAVQCPRAAPGAFRIIFLLPVPADRGPDQDRIAETSRLHGFPRRACGGGIAGGKNG
ncbi:hypothetical protein SDC9_209518 [bioreactor metagenome]|uniref:Uncharacterized protein n=1 Tax=bioreactor metagenome TaxID=1076179 RepID=A0A645JE92_9ZZZZ